MRDRDVRFAMRVLLDGKHGHDHDTRIVEEMGIWSGSVRIDIAVINGELSGYELKSDSDTLRRLPFQAEVYGKVFDKVTLVVGTKHSSSACEQVPEWWGLVVASDVDSRIALEELRAASPNPSPDPYLVAQLLWKDEAIAALETHGLARGWRSKKIRAIHQRLASELPFDVLSGHVRFALKRREVWLRQVMPSNLDMPVYADPDPVL